MDRVNLCILGCGGVARRHARAARGLGARVNLTFASRTAERATAFNREFAGGGAFGSYEEACAAWEVDAVLVCTPPALHLPNVELAARHGKAILLEKPAARTSAELAALESAVRRHGVSCMIAENYFYKPLLRRLQRWIADGHIGAPLIIELNRTGRQANHGWREDAAAMGGGALLEGGVHWIDFLCELGGPVRDVLAAAPRRPDRLAAPVEDTLQVLVRFTGGAVGKLLHSWNLPNRLFGLGLSRILGTEGTITFESNGVAALLAGRRTRVAVETWDAGGARATLAHFVDCVRQGRQPAASLAVARRDLEVVWAAYRSLETGRFEPPAAA